MKTKKIRIELELLQNVVRVQQTRPHPNHYRSTRRKKIPQTSVVSVYELCDAPIEIQIQMQVHFQNSIISDDEGYSPSLLLFVLLF